MVVVRPTHIGSIFAVLALAPWVGCGSGDNGNSTPDTNTTSATMVPATAAGSQVDVSTERYPTPDVTVSQFLTALKNGDQPRATSMLTVKAQQEMARSEAVIQPPGSPTAEFVVTQSEFVGEQQESAHVLSVWTDTEDDGTRSTHEIVWILKRETSGWAVSGFATRVFDDQPPLILDFENPQELQQKRAAVDAEIARRNQPQSVRQAELPQQQQLR